MDIARNARNDAFIKELMFNLNVSKEQFVITRQFQSQDDLTKLIILKPISVLELNDLATKLENYIGVKVIMSKYKRYSSCSITYRC